MAAERSGTDITLWQTVFLHITTTHINIYRYQTVINPNLPELCYIRPNISPVLWGRCCSLHKRMLQLLCGMPLNEQISRFHWYAFQLHPLFNPMVYMWRNKRASTNPSAAQRLTETSLTQHHITEPYTQLKAQTGFTQFCFKDSHTLWVSQVFLNCVKIF